MAAQGGGFDFNQLAQQMGLGKSQSSGGGDGANEKETPELIIAGAEKVASTASKLTGGLIPNLQQLGQISLTQMIDKAESWIDKKINESAASMNARGGFIAQLASVLMKNSTITDQTGGTGGGGGGDYGGGGGGGGGDYTGSGGGGGHGGGGDFFSHSNFSSEMVASVSYGDKMVVVPMTEERLGNLTPSSGTDLSAINKGNIEIG